MIGVIGKKVGMTQVFDERGVLTPVTVIRIVENTVVSDRTEERDGYKAVVVGAFDAKKNRVTKPYAGQFGENISPKQRLIEFKDFDHECSVGDTFGIELLEGFEYVDVIGTSKGKGYQGVIKRHGASGGKMSHGSKFHRGLGSTGMAAWPSKVQKGSKMPGRMGAERRTVQNLRVIGVDVEKKVVLVKGAVPGKNDGMVVVRTPKKMEL